MFLMTFIWPNFSPGQVNMDSHGPMCVPTNECISDFQIDARDE